VTTVHNPSAHSAFLTRLERAEEKVEAGRFDCEFYALVRELSDMAVGSMAQDLAGIPGLRRRFDRVWMFTDPECRL
jgi:hypothetical protein